MENYGKIISALRKEKGLTQNDLGRELNVTYQAVSTWENDLSRPDFDTIAQMCKIFGITVDEFTRLASGEALPATPTAEPVTEQIPAVNKEIAPAMDTAPQSAPVLTPAQPAPAVDKPVSVKANRHVSPWKLFGLIMAIIAGLGVFIGLNFLFGWTPNLLMLVSFFAGYFVFSFIACIGHETVVWDFLEGCFFKSINIPGVIFTLDIDGIVFLIVYKFIIAPLATVVVWLGCVIGGFVISLCMAGFVFPFCTPKIFRGTFWGTGD